jgi:hypothetical protein
MVWFHEEVDLGRSLAHVHPERPARAQGTRSRKCRSDDVYQGTAVPGRGDRPSIAWTSSAKP